MGRHQLHISSFAAAIALGLLTCSALGDEPALPDAQRISRLVKQLDADEFSTRQLAHKHLVRIGSAALPQLIETSKSGSAEARYRAESIVKELQHRALLEGFGRIAKSDDAQIDLDEGMFLIARILDPLAKREPIDRRLDAFASRVRTRLGKGVDPRSAPPRTVVDAIVHVIFVEDGFSGNRADYDNPNNSSLIHVLQRKQGLPILLCHLVVSVGERLDVPLVGLQVPGRYMLKYDGARAPPDEPREDIVIDAYGDGEVLSLEQVKERIPTFDPEQHLVPSSRRATLTRMLRNLYNDLEQAGRLEEARQVEQYLALCEEPAS